VADGAFVSLPRVLIYRAVDDTGRSHRELAAAGCDVAVAPPGASRAELEALAADADVLLGATVPRGAIDRALLACAPRLRLVAKYTIGVDDVDVVAATERGVLVAHSPTEANWGGVAEGTLALVLALLKRVRERDRHVKAGGWRDPALLGTYLGARADGHAGITVGIVGLGRAGGRVAELFAPWRVRILACDPYVADETFARLNAQRVPLETLLGESDVVTLHCNLTRETRGMLDAARLKLMKPSAVLVNTARGRIVDLDALGAALERGALAAAALDVLPEEPPPPDARVLALGDRVLLMPHMVAANEGGTLGAAVPLATAAVLAALRGAVPAHVCNGEAVAAWRARFGARPLIVS
jgi:phosphoglycerate dehydrogenase-like enzyme